MWGHIVEAYKETLPIIYSLSLVTYVHLLHRSYSLGNDCWWFYGHQKSDLCHLSLFQSWKCEWSFVFWRDTSPWTVWSGLKCQYVGLSVWVSLKKKRKKEKKRKEKKERKKTRRTWTGPWRAIKKKKKKLYRTPLIPKSGITYFEQFAADLCGDHMAVTQVADPEHES